jgi:hypothetical protein
VLRHLPDPDEHEPTVDVFMVPAALGTAHLLALPT